MKALVGAWDHRPYQMLAEITALRARVAQLEGQVAELARENALLREGGVAVEPAEVVLTG